MSVVAILTLTAYKTVIFKKLKLLNFNTTGKTQRLLKNRFFKNVTRHLSYNFLWKILNLDI